MLQLTPEGVLGYNAPIADAGADQVVLDTVILRWPVLPMTEDGQEVSSEWTLQHRETPAYDRDASGIHSNSFSPESRIL